MTHGHRQQCGDMVTARGKGGRGWVEVGKGGEWGASVIVSTIKILKRKKEIHSLAFLKGLRLNLTNQINLSRNL